MRRMKRIAAGLLAALALLPIPAAQAERAVALARLPLLDNGMPDGLPETNAPVELRFGGEALPYDAEANTYYLPVASTADPLPGGFAVLLPDGWRASARRDGGALTVVAEGGGETRASRAILTTLPVLCVSTESGALPGADDEPGALDLYEPTAGGLRVTRTPIEINLRGNTSRRLPKRSYRVKIVDEWGFKRDLSVAGLRADDDWILNPMYADTSKIREALGYWLWDEINSCGAVAATTRVAYAEVLMNGGYYGLYGVQERIDRKQVGADRRAGVLYKVLANDRPPVSELLACADELCGGLKLQFAGDAVREPWLPAAGYLALLAGEEGPGGVRLSPENTVDFALWAMLCQAHDCHFKNQFVHAVPDGGGYVLYRIPWDLNNTFGDVWKDGAPDVNNTEYRLARLVQDDVLKLRLAEGDPEFAAALAARWRELRRDIATEEHILAHAHALYDGLFDAIDRDGERWPNAGLGEGNARNIRDIEDYIRAILPRIDTWIDELTEANGHGEDMDR